VAAGQLIVPFGPPLALETGYWLVWRRGPGTTRPLTAFRTWLAEELAGTERSADPVNKLQRCRVSLDYARQVILRHRNTVLSRG
jgi:hypothetical protein